MPTTTRSAAAAKARADVKANAKLVRNIDDGAAVTFGDPNGVCVVVSAKLADGKLRTGGAAGTVHLRGADKSSVKGITLAALEVFETHKDEIRETIQDMDLKLRIGAHLPVKETPVATPKLDSAKVAALSADEQTVLAALLAKLS